MRKAAGILLLSFGHLVNILVLLGAIVYAFGLIAWMHTPVIPVLQTIIVATSVPLLAAWAFRAAGRRAAGNLPEAEQQKRNAPLAPLSPLRQRLRVAAGVIAGVAVIVLAASGYAEYRCMTDRSRFTPAAEAEALKNGYSRVCRIDMRRYDISFAPLDRAIRKLAFTPVDLTHTPFAAFDSLGGSVEYVTDIPARLYRGFRMPDGHRLTLSEHDISADGVRTFRRPEDEPERINGLRARLNVMEVKPGQAISHLSWVEGRRSYELWMDANVAREPLRAQLFALAASLPESVPACPNEPPEPPGATEWERFVGPAADVQMHDIEKLKKAGARPCR